MSRSSFRFDHAATNPADWSLAHSRVQAFPRLRLPLTVVRQVW